MQSMFNNINRAREVLQGKIVNTPSLKLNEDDIQEILPHNADVSIKLELFQQTGSFKARGVAIGLETLEEDKKAQGIVTVTGGNHGIATAWGASQYNISAKIIMPKTADPFRIDKCRSLGAEVILAENVDDAFAKLDEIEKDENRFVLHPFNQENMIIGSATCCAEIIDQMGDIDILIIDYMQLITGFDKSESRQQEISYISRSLKALAKELQVPVVALSQLSRAVESRTDHRPIMSDLRESGAIEQDADLIAFIYRDDQYNDDSPDKGTAEVLVRKQRNGPTFTTKLTFLKECTRFENFAPEIMHPEGIK